MSTFCHGIASAQSLDKSSEIVDIRGLDITSLPKTGIINYEHKSDIPGQICGKVLTAKKIFDKGDCSNEHEEYFWQKCKVPFVYITAELLDDYTQSGKDAAGILRYDHDKKDQNKHAILGFSVEGSEIPNSRGSNKIIVARGIARKVTLTSAPCNSQCIAELLVDSPKSQIKDDFEELFRSDNEAITLFKSGEGEKIYEQFLAKKETDSTYKPTYADAQTKDVKIGTTKSGKHVFSHGPVGSYGFNPAEHKEAAEHHIRAAVTADNPKLIDNHIQRMKEHNLAAVSGGSQQNEAARSLQTKDKSLQATGKQTMQKNEKVCKHKKLLKDAPPPNMSASPAEPNAANAAAMQAGAMSGGTSFGDAMSNIKSGLGFGKSGNLNKAKVDQGKSDKQKSTDRAKRNIRTVDTDRWGRTGIPGSDSQVATRVARIEGGISPGKKGIKVIGNPMRGKDPLYGTGENLNNHKSRLEGIKNAPKPDLGKTEKTKNLDKASVPGSKYPSAANAVGQKPLTSVGGIPNFGPIPKEPSMAPPGAASSGGIPKFGPIDKKEKPLKKAITAGSYNAAPSTLVNGAAYQRESLGAKSATTGAEENSFQGTKKKDWNKRAKDDYERWPHREKFEKFMQARMPHLTMGEIKAIGRVISLKKSIEFEKELTKLVLLNKSELDEKSLKQIQIETAEKWCARAEDAYKRAIAEKSVKWLMDAIEYGHESIEHSSLGEDLAVFEKIRAKLMPIHAEAVKTLVPDHTDPSLKKVKELTQTPVKKIPIKT